MHVHMSVLFFSFLGFFGFSILRVTTDGKELWIIDGGLWSPLIVPGAWHIT